MKVGQPLLIRVFERVTATRASERIATTLGRFAPYLAGMVVAKGLSTIGQLLVGRWLGPAEMGHLTIVIATSTVIASPVASAWGGAFVRYAAGTPATASAALLRSTRRQALAWTGTLALAVALLSPLLAPALGVPPSMLACGAVVAAAMALWLFAKAVCQGRENWRRFVAAEAGFGGALVLASSVLLFAAGGDWRWASLVYLGAYALGSVPAWGLLRGGRQPGAEVPAGHDAERTPERAAAYARFALFTGAANTIFLYGDRFAAQRVLGFTEVGIYQVYNLATLGVATLLSTLIYNFVFPLFAQGDRRAFGALFRTGFARLLPITALALFTAGWLQIHLCGFPFRPALLALATLSATASIASSFYGHLIASLGVNGARLGARVAGATLVVFALGVVPAVRAGGLAGLFLFYTGIFIAVAVFYDRALRRLVPA